MNESPSRNGCTMCDGTGYKDYAGFGMDPCDHIRAGRNPASPQEAALTNVIHPAPVEFAPDQLQADPILRFFHYGHLPEKLQGASKPFCDLAGHIVTTLPRNPERTVALRKLLEAKDAAVRANVQ
ncbi:hypothetical protein [Novosphingobium clariflavum]|uniref:Uncharacterized protein n=1 Tax=Novosphingobium clariflavum TaxID=2029884 RepID=A0ABV6S1T7_9SPHN|nr:hypothetical protein [Novosphingobium clariflavum]